MSCVDARFQLCDAPTTSWTGPRCCPCRPAAPTARRPTSPGRAGVRDTCTLPGKWERAAGRACWRAPSTATHISVVRRLGRQPCWRGPAATFTDADPPRRSTLSTPRRRSRALSRAGSTSGRGWRSSAGWTAGTPSGLPPPGSCFRRRHRRRWPLTATTLTSSQPQMTPSTNHRRSTGRTSPRNDRAVANNVSTSTSSADFQLPPRNTYIRLHVWVTTGYGSKSRNER